MKNGISFNARLEWIVIEDDDGNITQTRMAISDISTQKRLEAEKIELAKTVRKVLDEAKQ